MTQENKEPEDIDLIIPDEQAIKIAKKLGADFESLLGIESEEEKEEDERSN